jgi:hypothetical protein
MIFALASLGSGRVRSVVKTNPIFALVNLPSVRWLDAQYFNLRHDLLSPAELGDSGPISRIKLFDPMGLGEDSAGNVYVSDRGGGVGSGRVIWRFSPDGQARVIAGTGRRGVASTSGLATDASLGSPQSICVDSLGRVYIADSYNHAILRIELDGRLTRFAGTGRPGAAGDGGPASEAELNQPYDISLSRSGKLFIADFGNHRIRMVASGTIHTVAGTGDRGYAGDGGPAQTALLNGPYGVFAEAGGGFLIGDSFNNVIRRVDAEGTISTLAGNGRAGYSGDGGLARHATLDAPQAIFADRSGRIYIGDEHNHSFRRVDAEGVISQVAGTGVLGFSPDGTPANQARLNDPENIIIRSNGSVLFTEAGNHRVRTIDPEGRLLTFAGGL